MNTQGSLLITFTWLLLTMLGCESIQELKTYADYTGYEGDDLGVRYSPYQTTFKLWTPVADRVVLRIYSRGEGGEAESEHSMAREPNGIWSLSLQGDYESKFYTFQTIIGDSVYQEVPDPYAAAVGVNGDRGAIIDLRKTNPPGWDQDQGPKLVNYTDAILYELHVRDLSMYPESGIKNKGKYLGLTEAGTSGPNGVPTGLDHLSDLGVTHIHLLPVYDYASVDESRLEENVFNWGYDPKNYNAPEGSYSSDPYDPYVRINEFKLMVKSLHDRGLGVIMDVVYNHTYETTASLFNQIVPGYYYRQNEDGTFSDASACGNEVASDREMVRKLIIESVKFWATEYHIDGFRFDLMGILDIETMNQVRAELDKINPQILLYGEGWAAGPSPLPQSKQAMKKRAYKLDRIAVFSDDIRDGLKGSVFEDLEKGFVSGRPEMEESIKFGVVAGTHHPQVNYDAVNYSDSAWAAHPYHCITYVSAHDNHTLWDKLEISSPEDDEITRIKMHKLAHTIVLTSQGISFLHAGFDFLRTKYGDHNSYRSPDSVNWLDWNRKAQYLEVHNYYRNLIALRKSHPAFRMTTTEDIKKNLSFLEMPVEQMIGYQISNNANGDSWKNILVLFNGNDQLVEFELPEGKWLKVLDENRIDQKGFESAEGIFTLEPIAAVVLVQK